jgi:guanylate kinase
MSLSLIRKNDLMILNTDEMNILNAIMSYLSLTTNKNEKPLIILGPSGVGKDTIINMLLKKYPEIFYKLPSYTTRKIRKGEKEGVDYFFITKEEFQVKRNQNKLIGIQEYNDNFYASDKSKLNELMNKGDKIIILNYNIETANKVKDEFDFNFIAILPPCEDELRNRLKSRGTNPEEMEKRMNNSLKEMKLINEANYIQFRVVNDEKSLCFTKVENHIKKLYPKFFRDISIIN